LVTLANTVNHGSGATTSYAFTGALNGGVVTGTSGWKMQFNYPSIGGATGGGSFPVPVTLR
jgi:hypothetical protein